MGNSSQGETRDIDRIEQEVKKLKAEFRFNTARKQIEKIYSIPPR